MWGNGTSQSNVYAYPDLGKTGSNNLIDEAYDGHHAINGNSYVGDAAGIFVNLVAASVNSPTTGGNYQLIEASPAIDRGSNTLYPGGAGALALDLDMAGEPRLLHNMVDMGAFEFQGGPGDPHLYLPTGKTYKIGDELDFFVNYFKPIAVEGRPPYIEITLGSALKHAMYAGASDDDHALIFRYTVSDGDVDNNGIEVASVIVPNEATISDGGLPAKLNGGQPLSTRAIRVDGIRPQVTVSSVGSDNANPAFAKTGDVVTHLGYGGDRRKGLYIGGDRCRG